MSGIIEGQVKNGMVVPNTPLPEGAKVEIRLSQIPMDESVTKAGDLVAEGGEDSATQLSAGQLRRLPREERQAILAAAAQLAEQDYLFDKHLTDFQDFR